MRQLNFPLELKALNEREFEGHGAVFGNRDLGGDVITRGAFKGTLAEHQANGTRPAMLWMHDPHKPIGRWDSISEDAKGLKVKGTLADTDLGNEVRELLKMKAVSGMSIGFRTLERDFTDDGTRIIKAVDLWEVSVVTMAMNPLAKVTGVKSQLSASGEYVPTQRELEHMLRDLGMSRNVARSFCAKAFDAGGTSGMLETPDQWDAGEVVDDEAKQLLDYLNSLTDTVGAASLRRGN